MKTPNSNQEYIALKRKRKAFIIFFQIFLLIGFILLWEASVNLGFINEFLVSKP